MSHTSNEFPVVMRDEGAGRRIVEAAHSLANLLSSNDTLTVASHRPLIVTSFGPATINIDRPYNDMFGAIVPNDQPNSLVIETHSAVSDDWMVNFYRDQWCGTGVIAHEDDRDEPAPESVQGSLYYYLGGAWFVSRAVDRAYLGLFGDAVDAPEDPRYNDDTLAMLQRSVERNHNFVHPGLVEAVDLILDAA